MLYELGCQCLQELILQKGTNTKISDNMDLQVDWRQSNYYNSTDYISLAMKEASDGCCAAQGWLALLQAR
jgi:hypothetical protein